MSLSSGHLYEFEPFVLDSRSRILLKGGATVRLTPRAFDTLLVLVQNASQVVDKEQLMKEVWPDIFVEEGSLSRNIYEVRKALGDDPAEPRYIETIPKRGYRFVAPVKMSGSETRPTGTPDVEGETTVIEKHTFARVVSEEMEGKDLPVHSVTASPVTEVTAFVPAGIKDRRKQIKQAVVVVGFLLVAAAIGVFLYLKYVHVTQATAKRAKSTLVRLTNNTAQDTAPSWSSDGRKIAFASNRDGKREIYVMDVDGSNQTRLTRNSVDDRAGTWSPDGNRIAFASNRDNSNPYNFDIYVMNADGSNAKRIVDDPEYDSDPSWSPDGQKILFVTGRNNNFDIYEMNADGTGQRNLTADSNRPDIWPVWSPDGNNIAFVRNMEGKEQIYVMDADGGNLIRVTNNSATNSTPTWSPDGSKLVFPTDRDGNWEIYEMSVEGELTRLTDDSADDLFPD